jgi:hypothetical protein
MNLVNVSDYQLNLLHFHSWTINCPIMYVEVDMRKLSDNIIPSPLIATIRV